MCRPTVVLFLAATDTAPYHVVRSIENGRRIDIADADQKRGERTIAPGSWQAFDSDVFKRDRIIVATKAEVTGRAKGAGMLQPVRRLLSSLI